MSLILTARSFATWLAFAAALCAIGGLLLHHAGRIESTGEYLYYSIWIGLALVVLALYVWHCFLPLDGSVQLAFGVPALARARFESPYSLTN